MTLDNAIVAEIDDAIDAGVAEANEGLVSAGADDSLDTADAPAVDADAGGGVEAEGKEVVSVGDRDDEVGAGGDGEVVVAAPSLPSALIERAVRVGFSLDDARAFANENALTSVCDKLEAKAVVEEAEKDDPLDALANLDTDEYEPEVVKMFGALTEEIRAQREKITALQTGQEQSARSRQEESAREVVQWFDSQIEKLGDDYAEALGKGAHSSLVAGSQQLAKREAIAERTSILMAGYQATGRQMPSRDEIFAQAAQSVLAEEAAGIRDKKVQKKLGKRAGQHIARGSDSRGREGSTVSPSDEVADLLDKKFFGKG